MVNVEIVRINSFVLEKDFNINSPPPITSVIENLIPNNPIKAFSEGNMLQIIIFAIIVGITITKMQIGQKIKLKNVFTSLNDLFLKMIDIIMFFAPIGVFFLILKTFMSQGFSTILELASYFFTVLLVLIIHFFLSCCLCPV